MNATEMRELMQRVHESFNEYSQSRGMRPSSAPLPGADAAALAAFEGTHRDWPRSYKTFLSLHNGWEGFSLVFTLIGAGGAHTEKALKRFDLTIRTFTTRWTERYGEPTPEKIAEFERGADLGKKTELDAGIYLPHMMLFGTDFAGSLYYFYNDGQAAEKERQVVERDVYGEIIRVSADFPAFLQDTLKFRQSLIRQ